MRQLTKKQQLVIGVCLVKRIAEAKGLPVPHKAWLDDMAEQLIYDWDFKRNTGHAAFYWVTPAAIDHELNKTAPKYRKLRDAARLYDQQFRNF